MRPPLNPPLYTILLLSYAVLHPLLNLSTDHDDISSSIDNKNDIVSIHNPCEDIMNELYGIICVNLTVVRLGHILLSWVLYFKLLSVFFLCNMLVELKWHAYFYFPHPYHIFWGKYDNEIVWWNVMYYYICTIPVNSLRLSEANTHQQSRPALVQIMAWRLISTKPSSELMLA